MTTASHGRSQRRTLRVGAITLAVAAAAAMTAVPVSADVEREQRGACGGTSRWELSLEKEHGRIEIDLELDTRRAGRAWRITMAHEGASFLTTRRVTDREGEVDLDRRRSDRASRDRISFRAVDTVNGEVCRGSVRI
jgi:hypothetical protein